MTLDDAIDEVTDNKKYRNALLENDVSFEKASLLTRSLAYVGITVPMTSVKKVTTYVVQDDIIRRLYVLKPR